MSDKFDLEKAIELINKCFETKQNVDISYFPEILQQFLMLMKQFSSMVSLAFSDINEKKVILENIVKLYNQNDLFKIIEIEKNQNLLPLNGDNNYKLTNVKELQTYVSAARTVNVLIRFFTFVAEIFKLTVDKNLSFKQVLKQSYNLAFSKHHSWMIRKSAEAAFLTCPSREFFIGLLGTAPEQNVEKLYQSLNELNTFLYQQYEKNNLLILP